MSVFLQYIYMHILFIIFHIPYFDHILFPSQLLPDLPYLSTSPISPVLFLCLPSLFLKQVNPSQNKNNVINKTKTNKRSPKRQKWQKKTKSRKKTQTWSSVCVSNYVWPVMEFGWYTQWKLCWRKPIFSCPVGVYCKIAFWLGMGLCVPFAGLAVCLASNCADLCILLQSPWACMCFSPVVSGWCCCLGNTHHPWLLQSFHFLFHSDPWTLLEGFDEDIALSAECSNVCHSLHVIQL